MTGAQQYRAHLQAFVDRWRYNANRAAQAQSKLKIIEKLPELEPPEAEDVVKFSFAEADKLSAFNLLPLRLAVANMYQVLRCCSSTK